MRHATRPAKLTLITLLAASWSVVSGCLNTNGGFSLMSEGGVGASLDSHVYVSRSWQPWTVTVRDTRTGQAFWSIDVPVGKKLALQFVRGSGTDTQYSPDLMKWGLMDEFATFSNLTNSLPVPAADSRRLEPTLRAVPELPPDMTGQASASVQVR
jgi:hypothetical protein